MNSKRKMRNIYALAIAPVALGLASCDSASPPQPAPRPVALSAPPAPVSKPPADMPAAKPGAGEKADEELAARVRVALAAEPGLQSFTMDVVASRGVVSLIGTAPNRATRDRAANIAVKVEGVNSVVNKLAIVAGS